MKVKKLKELLSQCNDDTEIVIEYKEGSVYFTKNIECIGLAIGRGGAFYKVVAD